MDANNPEVKRVLNEALKDLRWMRAETKQNQQEIETLTGRIEQLYKTAKITPYVYRRRNQKLAASRTKIHDSLKMIQRQHTLITSWLVAAESQDTQ